MNPFGKDGVSRKKKKPTNPPKNAVKFPHFYIAFLRAALTLLSKEVLATGPKISSGFASLVISNDSPGEDGMIAIGRKLFRKTILLQVLENQPHCLLSESHSWSTLETSASPRKSQNPQRDIVFALGKCHDHEAPVTARWSVSVCLIRRPKKRF